MKIAEGRERVENQNRELRDAVYTSRYCDPEKAKLMSQPLQEAAAIAGVSIPVMDATAYRLAA